MHDLTGSTFGSLTILRRAHDRTWLYECACGARYAVHEGALLRGAVTCCPECWERERNKKGQSRGLPEPAQKPGSRDYAMQAT